MVEKEKISVHQFMISVTLFTIGTTILIAPATVVTEAKQDGWISAILFTGIGLLLVLFYNTLGNIFPNMTLVELSIKLLGKWIGNMVAFIYVSFFLYSTAALLFYVGNFLTTQMLPGTPIQSIIILLTGILIMGVYYGIETLARFAEIVFPFIALLFLILVITISPQVEFQNIQPIFEGEIKSILHGGLFYFSNTFLMLITLLMIFPTHMNEPIKAKKAFIFGSLIGGIILIIIILLSILVLGHYITSTQAYPSYTLFKKISIGNFLERIEVVMATIWFITIYFKMTMYFYGAVLGLTQMLKLNNYRPLLLPLGMFLVPFSLVIYPNTAYMQTFETTVWIPYSFTLGLFLPLLLFGVAIFRKNALSKNT
ncbi:GerAB/ArcD/ProY family transporter [Bacillus taeanensis]|uniref:Spore gernimation protein n=1 Tax=Bacillus taeanensis TaxID=273032 RepID=A0A366XUT9_9BACI|nr:endospore germination permease [Bacillus taeanensis]RBW68539.1 spore gernimation protein [Bacillus taeanensis]